MNSFLTSFSTNTGQMMANGITQLQKQTVRNGHFLVLFGIVGFKRIFYQQIHFIRVILNGFYVKIESSRRKNEFSGEKYAKTQQQQRK